MYYAAIILLASLSTSGYKLTVYGAVRGDSDMIICTAKLVGMRKFVVALGREDRIIKEACWSRKRWTEFLGRDPWKKEGQKI